MLRVASKICAECGNAFRKDPRNTWKYWARAKYCGKECFGLAEKKRMALLRKPISDAFFSFVEKTDGCWLWIGAKDRDGYGSFTYLKKTHRAHRLSLQMTGENVPKGAFVCHDCDNPTCVNPSHLYVGTPQSNVSDAVSRGRQMRGEKSTHAKLTERDIREIRMSSMSDAEIAMKYGVCRPNVNMIRNYRIWKHVP